MHCIITFETLGLYYNKNNRISDRCTHLLLLLLSMNNCLRLVLPGFRLSICELACKITNTTKIHVFLKYRALHVLCMHLVCSIFFLPSFTRPPTPTRARANLHTHHPCHPSAVKKERIYKYPAKRSINIWNNKTEATKNFNRYECEQFKFL